MTIRPSLPRDRERLREICVLTGAAGGDATGRWSRDELLPDLFLDPYLEAAPDWAWVVDAGDGPVGYLVSVPDTLAFADWWRAVWTPRFAERWPRPPRRAEGDPAARAEDELVERGHDPAVLEIPELATHPAHLHIDLLPPAQGRGSGRALIATLGRALEAAGVPGVHLAMDPANTPARAFYDRLGFAELASSTPTAPVLGLSAREAARLG